MSNNERDGWKKNSNASDVSITSHMTFNQLAKPTLGGDDDSPSLIAEKVYPPAILPVGETDNPSLIAEKVYPPAMPNEGDGDSPSLIVENVNPPTKPNAAFQIVECTGDGRAANIYDIPRVEAIPVHNQSIDFLEGTRDGNTHGRLEERICYRKVKFVLALSLISITAVTAGLLFVLNIQKEGSTGEDSEAPIQSPTRSNIGRISNVLIENGIIVSEDLDNASSPHSKAFQWLGWEDEIPLDDDDHIIQRYCLALLYYSTGGDNWKKKGNWLENQHECGWNIFSEPISGVKDCNERMQVTELDLGYNGLEGVIPSEISHLKALEKLYMGSNALSSTIPESIGYIQNLTHLELDFNALSGTIPSSFGNLEGIVSLKLYSNKDLDIEFAEDICTIINSTKIDFLHIECDISCSCCNSCYRNK